MAFDGTNTICISTKQNQVGDGCRVLLEGQYLPAVAGATAATVDVVRRILSVADIDKVLGRGSVLAEAARKIFECCPRGVDLNVIPRANPVGATAAVYTYTVAGTATTAGSVDIFVGEKSYSVSVNIPIGTTATAAATLIMNALQPNVPVTNNYIPFTITQAAGVLTFTAKNTGEVGNYLNIITNWKNLQGTMPSGLTFTTAQTIVAVGNLTTLNYSTVLGECCYSCFVPLYSNTLALDNWKAYMATLWDCTRSQCFGHLFAYVPGSLGTISAYVPNSATMSVMPWSTVVGNKEPDLPWLAVAAWAARCCCVACTSPEAVVQGPIDGVLSCVSFPGTCKPVWTQAEREQLMALGYTIMMPVSYGTGVWSNRYVVNDITSYITDDVGVKNLTFRDRNSRTMSAYIGAQLAKIIDKYKGLALFDKRTNVKAGTKGTTIGTIRADLIIWAKNNVGVLFSEFDDIQSSIQVFDDFDTAPQCQGIPGAINVSFTYSPPPRLSKVNTNMTPVVLNNCAR